MPLTETAIESAIERLKSSPGKFQRLLECYVHLVYPQRFKNLVPLGRTRSDVPVKGWPDVLSLSSDGRMDVAEATHSSAWPTHLEEDLEKAESLGKGRLASFLFVAWSNEPSPLTDHKGINPRYEKLMKYRDRLVALEIPPDRINFVFKKQLVRALTAPRFASVLKEVLGLPCHSLPFRLISQDPRIFGQTKRRDVFAPAREEYLSGLVHRPAIADQVEQGLESTGWQWVRGRGAAGKTVLAIQIGLRYESRLQPAYYLDLAETDTSASEALDAITTHADDRVLFIIDNVHLDQSFARDVFDHCRVDSKGSHLLMLSRDVSFSDPKGVVGPLDELAGDALPLEVTADDLAGVFLRLARRLHPDYISQPSHETLQQWNDLFGGDLIAFSAAVVQRLRQLIQGDWRLQAQDAAKYVKETYLEKASEGELLNLLRLAVLALLEVSVPEDAIDLAKIRPFLRSGLVQRLARGSDGQYEQYHLVHPGLGDLLLTAASYSGQELNQFISEQFRYVTSLSPFCGTLIATRLESANREQEAIAVLKSIVESDQALVTALIPPSLQFLRFNCERLVRLSLFSESEIDKKLAGEYLAIGQSSLSTPLHFLTSSLEYAESKLPEAYKSLVAALAQPENVEKVTATALHSPLHFLASFLEYAERKLPTAFTSLAAVLAQPENDEALSATALRTPLGDLASFLEYAERKLPTAFTSLRAALAQPENLQTIGATALRTPLDQLASFLEYAERNLQALSRFLNERLEEPRAITAIAAAASRAPMDSLLKFLQTIKIAPAVVSAIDRDEWDKSRVVIGSEQPHYFHALAPNVRIDVASGNNGYKGRESRKGK